MKLFTGILLTLMIAVNHSMAQKIKPSLQLTKGTTYYMISTANSAITQILNGKENNVNLSFKFRLAFKVADIMDTTYNMEVSYQSIDMKIQVSGQTIEMDSKKNDPKDIPSSIISAMINRPFNIILTKTGKITSVDNIEKMITGVFDGFPQIDSSKKEQIKAQFNQSFGANAFKSSLETATAIFPDKPVAKNDKWTINTSKDVPARANVETVYQLIDLNNDCYQIHGEGSMTTDNDSKPGLINGMPMNYNLSGTILADIKADRKTGWITEVNIKQLISGRIEIQDNPQMPGGTTIPVMFKTEETTTDK